MVHVGSLGGVYQSSVSFACFWVHYGALRGRRDQLGTLGFAQACLGAVGFIWIRLGSLVRA